MIVVTQSTSWEADIFQDNHCFQETHTTLVAKDGAMEKRLTTLQMKMDLTSETSNITE